MPIDMEKLNDALLGERGYYGMLLKTEDTPSSVLRFNINAFKNNYNLADLSKMELVYYGIKVGACKETELTIDKEFDFQKKKTEVTAESILDGDAQSHNEELYQLFDEGIYEDQNYRVDVRHAIIICTSNYKSKDEIKEKLGDPIFNRFDGVIKFEDLSQEAKKMIAAKELKELDEEKIIPENVRKILVEQSTKLENAREIRKLIKDTKSLIEIREICK